MQNDIKVWVQKVMHKYHLGWDISNEQAQQLVDMQTSVLVGIVLPESYVDSWPVRTALKFPTSVDYRNNYLAQIEDKIEANPTLFPTPASTAAGARPGV